MDDLVAEHQRDLLRDVHTGRRPWPGLIPIVRRLAMRLTTTWAARWTVGVLITVSLATAGQGKLVLATGEVSHSQNLVLRFTPQMGGGIYTETESRPKLYVPGGGETGGLL